MPAVEGYGDCLPFRPAAAFQILRGFLAVWFPISATSLPYSLTAATSVAPRTETGRVTQGGYPPRGRVRR
jgi:hypothetical protein